MSRRGPQPSVSPTGERLQKVAIKVFPERWKRLGELIGESERSAMVRRAIDREISRRERKGNGK